MFDPGPEARIAQDLSQPGENADAVCVASCYGIQLIGRADMPGYLRGIACVGALALVTGMLMLFATML